MFAFLPLEDEKDKWARCEKCRASYKLSDGRFSERRSCRVHQWDNRPFSRCLLCYQFKNHANKNCYHSSTESCCIIM